MMVGFDSSHVAMDGSRKTLKTSEVEPTGDTSTVSITGIGPNSTNVDNET